jgi:3-oxoadipate enol-lactonase
MIELRGRAPIWVHEAAGPEGAPTVMLLHGLGASAALNWFPAFAALARHFRVVAPDHRGHGRTPAGTEPFTLAGCAHDAFAVLDALRVAHAVVVGYSMGGPIAQLMWRHQPSRVTGMVLAATSRDFRGSVQDRLRFRTIPLALAASRLPGAGLLRGLLLELVAPRLQPDLRDWALDELKRSNSQQILEAAAELGRFSSRDWVRGVDVPTSVVVSMNDQLVPVRRQLKLARMIPGSVAAFVDGDHYAIGSTPETFVPTLVRECLSVVRRAEGPGAIEPAYWEVEL